MAYNRQPSTAPIRGLVNSGADLMKQMYDIKIFFPAANGQPDQNPFQSYPITVRASGFTIPEVTVATYDIKYHGVGIKRPSASMELERSFDITFREDAAFDLRRRFSAWMMAVADPVTGGVSNATQFFGRIEVGTIAGAYFATAMNSPNGDGKGPAAGPQDIQDTFGHLTTRNPMNPLALWAFYNVWVYKLGGIEFSTDAAEANTFTVGFQFMDMDYPQFGGNALDLGQNSSWASPTEWTAGLA